MKKAEVIREELKDNETYFRSLLLKMSNANLMLLSEEEDRLGTLAVAIPQTRMMVGQPTSSVLLGERNIITARIYNLLFLYLYNEGRWVQSKRKDNEDEKKKLYSYHPMLIFMGSHAINNKRIFNNSNASKD